MNLQLQATRVAMRALERTAPQLGAALAERLFFTPPRTSLTPTIRDVLATGRPFRVCVEDGRVAAWAWGHGPAVALVHGWGGRGGRLATAFVAPLVAQRLLGRHVRRARARRLGWQAKLHAAGGPRPCGRR